MVGSEAMRVRPREPCGPGFQACYTGGISFFVVQFLTVPPRLPQKVLRAGATPAS